MRNLTANSASLTVAENNLGTTIGISAPADASYRSSAATVTALPLDGIIRELRIDEETSILDFLQDCL